MDCGGALSSTSSYVEGLSLIWSEEWKTMKMVIAGAYVCVSHGFNGFQDSHKLGNSLQEISV